MADELAVEVRGLVKRFGSRVTAVDGLDLAVRGDLRPARPQRREDHDLLTPPAASTILLTR